MGGCRNRLSYSPGSTDIW
ncbi:MAG: hypothetical protein JEZ14_09675 [Marinilabiliaceae bacterium]|nr:hypothetical protein [Marinilabiliaceae bacterium]